MSRMQIYPGLYLCERNHRCAYAMQMRFCGAVDLEFAHDTAVQDRMPVSR